MEELILLIIVVGILTLCGMAVHLLLKPDKTTIRTASEEWISTKDRLPDDQRIVLVKTNKDSYSTAYCHGRKSGFIVYGEHAYKEFGDITHWREIN